MVEGDYGRIGVLAFECHVFEPWGDDNLFFVDSVGYVDCDVVVHIGTDAVKSFGDGGVVGWSVGVDEDVVFPFGGWCLEPCQGADHQKQGGKTIFHF